MKEYKITVATDPEKNNTFCVYTDTLIRAMQVADSFYRCAGCIRKIQERNKKFKKR